jgi:hypothetical protein
VDFRNHYAVAAFLFSEPSCGSYSGLRDRARSRFRGSAYGERAARHRLGRPDGSCTSLITALAIPFTYSIAAGIGVGFIAYAAIKIVSGRWREVNAAVAIIALAFVVKIALG